MTKKINSEIVIKNDVFKLAIGTTDKKNPSVIYVEGGMFIEPNLDIDPKENLLIVEKRYKTAVDKFRDILMSEKTGEHVFDNTATPIKIFEIAEDRLSPGKKSYLSFQFFLKQKTSLAFKDFVEKYAGKMVFVAEVLKKELQHTGFSVSKTKK